MEEFFINLLVGVPREEVDQPKEIREEIERIDARILKREQRWKGAFWRVFAVVVAVAAMLSASSGTSWQTDIFWQRAASGPKIDSDMMLSATVSAEASVITAQKLLSHVRGQTRGDIRWGAAAPDDISANAGFYGSVHAEVGVATYFAKKASTSMGLLKSKPTMSSWEIRHLIDDAVDCANGTVEFLNVAFEGVAKNNLHPCLVDHQDWIFDARTAAKDALDNIISVKRQLSLME